MYTTTHMSLFTINTSDDAAYIIPVHMTMFARFPGHILLVYLDYIILVFYDYPAYKYRGAHVLVKHT